LCTKGGGRGGVGKSGGGEAKGGRGWRQGMGLDSRRGYHKVVYSISVWVYFAREPFLYIRIYIHFENKEKMVRSNP